MTITISSFTDLPSGNASYATYSWTQDGISGKATIFANTSSTSMQFNASNYLFYSTSEISGVIKSIKLTTASGTNRTYVVYGSTSAYSGSGTSYGTQIGSQTVTTSGTTYTVSSGEYTYFTIVKTGSGAGYLSSVEVTYTPSGGGGGSQAAATTTTISDAGITNTDVYVGTAAGSLSATVTETESGNAVSGASVTWSGDNDDVATINANTGAVTLVAAGTVTFTATYAGVTGTYQGSSDTYEMTVTSSAPYVQPTEIEITPNYTFWGKNAQFSGSDNDELSGSKDNVTLEWSRGSGSTYANQTSMRFYKDNDLTFTAPTGYEIKSIVITFSTTQSDITFSPTGYILSDMTGTWTGAANDVTMSRPSNASNYAQITKFTITIGLPSSVATPTFSPAAGSYIGAQSITIACATTGAAIYYTLDGTTPTESSTLYSGAINITNNTTIKAIAIKEDESSSVATAEYTITTPLTTMQEIYDKAVQVGSTTTNVYITFNNWVVSGVASYYAFVTDGTKGFYINNYSGHGFNQGDVLSGTANCPLYLYNGSARLDITSSTTGLEVNSGGSVAVADIPMADLSGVNTGAVVSYHDLTYNNSLLSDGTTSIKPYTILYTYSSLTSGKKYNVTGVYWQYNTSTKEILPRSASEICLAAQMTAPSFEPFSYLYSDGGPATQNVAISGTDFTEALTVTAPENYQVSNDNSIWGTTTTFAQSSGNVSGTLYVRLVGGLEVGTYNGDLTFTSGNYLTTKTSALAGTVSANNTYAITLNQSSEATIAADYAVAEAGQTITLSYSNLDDCYTLTGWTVLDGNADEVPVTNNQFTMPASAVEVEGIFTLKTFTVQYSVNGEIKTALNQTGINCGDAVTLKTASDISAASISLPTGYTFAGWSTEADNTNIISSLIVSENTTLYAVLLPTGAATSYVKVTNLSEITAGTYFIVSDLYVLPSTTTSSAPVMSNDYIIGTSLSDTYNTPINGTLWYFTGTYEAMTIKNGDNNYLYTINQNNGVRVGSTSGTWTFETNSTGFAMKSNNNRYCATTDNSDWRSYGSANSQYYHDGGKIYLYKEIVPTSYTLIEDVSTTKTLPSIEPTYLITVKEGATLTVTGNSNGDETNLIIEDGGQLKVTDNATVKATVKKTVDAWEGSKDDDDGWYAISSPVNSPSIAETFGTGNDFNVYSYEEPVAYWHYYKIALDVDTYHVNAFTSLTNGRGYLYRSTSDAGIEFKGTVNAGDDNGKVTYGLSYDYNGSQLKGFNLVGNPFTHNITWDDNITVNNVFDDGFYMLIEEGTNKGQWVACTKTTPIAPTKAFLIQAKGESPSITIDNKVPVAGKGTNYANDNIMFVVKNAEYSDEAYVLFKKGHGLNKIEHRNAEIPMLYVISEGENYAIADMPDNTDVINLGFEAKTMGQYTISLKAEGQYSYMHLIDKLTGNDIDMLVEDSYPFVGSQNDRHDRFVLSLNYNAAGIDTESDIFAYQSGNDIIVSGEGELQVFDIMGRKVMTTDINGVQTINGMNTGVYIFRLNEKIQKIVVR